MIKGQIVGTVWGTRKIDELTGRKLVIVAEQEHGAETGRLVVAIDTLDCEPESNVIVSFGSAARHAVDRTRGLTVCADAAITQRIEGSSLEDEQE